MSSKDIAVSLRNSGMTYAKIGRQLGKSKHWAFLATRGEGYNDNYDAAIAFFDQQPEWAYFQSVSYFKVARMWRGCFIVAIARIADISPSLAVRRLHDSHYIARLHTTEEADYAGQFEMLITLLIQQFYGQQTAKKSISLPAANRTPSQDGELVGKAR